MNNFALYTQVMLSTDVPELRLMQGDVGTVIELLFSADGKLGYAVEFFDIEGNTVGVHMLSADQLFPVPDHSITQVREYKPA